MGVGGRGRGEGKTGTPEPFWSRAEEGPFGVGFFVPEFGFGFEEVNQSVWKIEQIDSTVRRVKSKRKD